MPIQKITLTMELNVLEQSRVAAQAAGMSLSGWLTLAARRERLRQWHSADTDVPAHRDEALQQAEEAEGDRSRAGTDSQFKDAA